ncbi:MAG: DUF3450 domain-containing protein [Eubacterium sp.]|nr:DUF3450 domain-containing protein [Eubacterium sp.]
MNPNGKLPNLKALEKRLEELRAEKEKLLREYRAVRRELAELNKTREQLQELDNNQRHRGRNDDIT